LQALLGKYVVRIQIQGAAELRLRFHLPTFLKIFIAFL
jgi:hypothetical protein